MTAQRDRSQAQAGRPPLGALVQRGRPTVGQSDPGRSEQFARLGFGKPQIGRPDLRDLVGEPQLVQPDRRIPT